MGYILSNIVRTKNAESPVEVEPQFAAENAAVASLTRSANAGANGGDVAVIRDTVVAAGCAGLILRSDENNDRELNVAITATRAVIPVTKAGSGNRRRECPIHQINQ